MSTTAAAVDVVGAAAVSWVTSCASGCDCENSSGTLTSNVAKGCVAGNGLTLDGIEDVVGAGGAAGVAAGWVPLSLAGAAFFNTWVCVLDFDALAAVGGASDSESDSEPESSESESESESESDEVNTVVFGFFAAAAAVAAAAALVAAAEALVGG